MPETRVVIIGAGFAGAEVARGLGAAAWVTLIDRHNYQLFQPLLYQVATAALSPADIAEPIRRLVRGRRNVEVVLGEVTEISTDDRNVKLADGSKLPYDMLVIATGATTAYFGYEKWSRFALGLKSISDARTIRSRLLQAFEQAEMTDHPSERHRLMTIVIVGGGPSGVELAGSIAELARYSLAKDFRKIDPKSAVVHVIEKGPRILPTFPKALSDYAISKLTELGVKVQENCAVKQISECCVETESETIPVAFAIWAAGARASPVAKMLGGAIDKAGRIKTNRDLDFGWLRLKGLVAWLLWALIHIYLLAGVQHGLLVAVQWLWRYLTYDRGARMIVEPMPHGRGDSSC